MPAYTFFHFSDLICPSEITLDEQESHHALSVMRLEIGEEAIILNGRGKQVLARLVSSKKIAKFKLLELIKEEPAAKTHLRVLQGLTSIAKADLIVEKLTELGIHEIAFFAADRSGRQKMNMHQLEKLEIKAIQACKQSGRTWLPKLSWYESLEDQSLAVNSSETQHHWVTLDPKGDRWQNAFHNDLSANYTLVIGPESGLSEKEMLLLDSFGAKRLNIHPNILRAETAAVAGACLLEHYTRH